MKYTLCVCVIRSVKSEFGQIKVRMGKITLARVKCRSDRRKVRAFEVSAESIVNLAEPFYNGRMKFGDLYCIISFGD